MSYVVLDMHISPTPSSSQMLLESEINMLRWKILTTCLVLIKEISLRGKKHGTHKSPWSVTDVILA